MHKAIELGFAPFESLLVIQNAIHIPMHFTLQLKGFRRQRRLALAIRPVGVKQVHMKHWMHFQVRWQFKPISNLAKALSYLEGANVLGHQL